MIHEESLVEVFIVYFYADSIFAFSILVSVNVYSLRQNNEHACSRMINSTLLCPFQGCKILVSTPSAHHAKVDECWEYWHSVGLE